jgi:putative endonuclease
MPYYLYIMASGPKGTLYVGVTSDLSLRVAQHKSGELGGFTARYA